MIRTDPQAAAARRYDLIVVGGGVYGVSLLLEAARRGVSALLLERGDFGHATSWNSLRILHGGLRYLQSMDLHRFGESVRERAWFMRQFPDLVRPLACLMPLYNRGLKRPGVFRLALALNDLLSCRRNRGLPTELRLDQGRVISAAEVVERLPLVDQRGLTGGATWNDAVMINSQRVLIEMLHWACALGAASLNYVEVIGLTKLGDQVTGVTGRDAHSGQTFAFHAPRVVNACGPWSPGVAKLFDRQPRDLFVPSLAFNLLLDRPAVSRGAVAVQPPTPGARMYFLQPWRGKLFAGTYHAPWTGASGAAVTPPAPAIQAMLADLNAALPGLEVTRSQVLRVYAGLLPTTRVGDTELTKREVIVDHARQGGPRGLVSVAGIKFTTARLVAQKTLRVAMGDLPAVRPHTERTPASHKADLHDGRRALALPTHLLALTVKRLWDDEAVRTLDDLMFRRTAWGEFPDEDLAVRERMAQLDLRHRGANGQRQTIEYSAEGSRRSKAHVG